jgi:hypothetical protein
VVTWREGARAPKEDAAMARPGPSCCPHARRHIPPCVVLCLAADSRPRAYPYIYRRRRRQGRNISGPGGAVVESQESKATDRRSQPAGRPIRAPARLAVASTVGRSPAELACFPAAVAAWPGPAACCRRLVCGYSGLSCWPRHRRCDTKRRGGHVGNGIVAGSGWSAAGARARARRGQGAAQVDAPAARPLRARRGPARRRRQ